jgi:uncharacterized protein (TIGR00730 family)
METPFRKHESYQTGNPKLDQLIHELIHQAGPGANADLAEELIVTALKVHTDKLDRGDMKMLNTAMKELRHSLKVFEPYRAIRKVAIFGSARTTRHSPDYQLAEKFAKEIVQRGWMVITGAASGIMQAGNEGAGHKKSFGLNIQLPFEQEANPVMLQDPKLVTFKYFFTRKLMFLRESHATILCPGGFGTHDEGFETLTLIQTGKTDPRPIVCLDAPDSTYWKGFFQFLRQQLLRQGMIHEEDLDLMYATHDPSDAVRYITDFYKMYHSMRYIRDLLVLRIEKPLSDKQLDLLNQEFKHLLKKGKIAQSLKPFDEERSAPYTFHLTRLSFYFKKDSFGNLTKLIHRINSFGD